MDEELNDIERAVYLLRYFLTGLVKSGCPPRMHPIFVRLHPPRLAAFFSFFVLLVKWFYFSCWYLKNREKIRILAQCFLLSLHQLTLDRDAPTDQPVHLS